MCFRKISLEGSVEDTTEKRPEGAIVSKKELRSELRKKKFQKHLREELIELLGGQVVRNEEDRRGKSNSRMGRVVPLISVGKHGRCTSREKDGKVIYGQAGLQMPVGFITLAHKKTQWSYRSKEKVLYYRTLGSEQYSHSSHSRGL